MNRFLLDTCVVSEPLKKRPDKDLINWWRAQSDYQLFLSTLVIGELEKGIQKLPQTERRADLARTLEALIKRFDRRVLHVDTAVARRWGKVTADCENNGQPIPALDGLIASTALVHDLIVVTRNVKDFSPTGAATFNPFSEKQH
ncbi:MAG: type II toxin-antitoxin system VapC family toxin [Myxococcota bacterium]|nr:type II toxin-antitoxin system VapC family toxin [Myxococcota bacterium]